MFGLFKFRKSILFIFSWRNYTEKMIFTFCDVVILNEHLEEEVLDCSQVGFAIRLRLGFLM